MPNFEYGFIELERTFHEISQESIESDDADIISSLNFANSLKWSDLIDEFRVIILSEAGSGKTAEIENVTCNLNKEGKTAFFIRLENIPNNFEDAFEGDTTYEDFEKWLASVEEGWLFLDSIDEARLQKPSDFELAIKKLGKRIKFAMDRCHIIITGRISAWRPKTDLIHCSIHLPSSTSKNSEGIDAKTSLQENQHITTKYEEKRDKVFKIVALEDLSSAQIKTFINARGIKNSKDFLDAVERRDAWRYTSRPQDLQELTEFWLDEGRLGSHFEIVQNSIERRITERDQTRAEIRSITTEKAYQGVKRLAAAATLTKTQAIRVPDGAENLKGIAVSSVLSDWNERDQSILLSRPIFTEAIYGTVRFHHRTVREFLTAQWFSELLQHKTSRRSIERLFFRKQYGIPIVSPTLRPILPWLVLLDEKIGDEVEKIVPEIIFEGGDPSRLPLEDRRKVLKEVCEKIHDKAPGISIYDYKAVQHFAKSDLSEDIRELIHKYASNKDLTFFLLRMVWLGRIKAVLPEAMSFALNPKAEYYTRRIALRLVMTIGSHKEQQRVHSSFLGESPQLKRDWLAEIIEGSPPTKENLCWLIECLKKVEPKEEYTVDSLTTVVEGFLGSFDIEFIPQIVTFLNSLLSSAPFINNRFCRISEDFKWLMTAAVNAIEHLIAKRHPGSFAQDSLDILIKFSVIRRYESYMEAERKTEFSKIIPQWKDLNRALFWFTIEKARESLEKEHGKRLTEFYQAHPVASFWKFDKNDFDYIAHEISNKEYQDNKLVALSLAFALYKDNGRPRKWLEKLKKIVTDNDELQDSLSKFLKPPAQSSEERRMKRQDARWKKEYENRRLKNQKNHDDWKNYLTSNIEKIHNTISDYPGEITNPMLYLFDQVREAGDSSNRWSSHNWEVLIPEFGRSIAEYYRNSLISFWRNYKPKLRSEGAPMNKTPYSVIFGLAGLEIESRDTKLWQKTLNNNEVELACRYASFELNGFPKWLPSLSEEHSKVVSKFLLKEIFYELSIEKVKTDTHYIINYVGSTGQWSWDNIAPVIYDYLKTNEPKNLSNLNNLLKIVLGSNLSDSLIDAMASQKSLRQKKHNHSARWFAVWVGVNPEEAIAALKRKLIKIAHSKKRTLFAMTFLTNLLGGDRYDMLAVRGAFNRPNHLKEIYLLMHKYIRSQDDIQRANMGAYSPGIRDYAQRTRDTLFTLLKQIPGKESFLTILELAHTHPDKSYEPLMLMHAKSKAEQDGDISPWLPSQVTEFQKCFEGTPNNHRELSELAVFRFLDLKEDLEDGDSSIAEILIKVKKETEIRNFIGNTLRNNSSNRYTISQEEERADAKKPDLRFHGKKFDAPVPVELKIADNWGGAELFERLENQLCGDYLRDRMSSIGIFVLMHRGKKKFWELPVSKKRVDFERLIGALDDHWKSISPNFTNIDDVIVVGIDLAKRLNRSESKSRNHFIH